MDNRDEIIKTEDLERLTQRIKEDGRRCFYVLFYMIAFKGYSLSSLISMRISEIIMEDDRICYLPRASSRLYPFEFPKEIEEELREIIDTRYEDNDYLFQSTRRKPILAANFSEYLKLVTEDLGITNINCKRLQERFRVKKKEKRPKVEDLSTKYLEVKDFVVEIHKVMNEVNVESTNFIIEILEAEDDTKRLLRMGKIIEGYYELLKELRSE